MKLGLDKKETINSMYLSHKYLASSLNMQTSTIIAILAHWKMPMLFFKISDRSIGSLL